MKEYKERFIWNNFINYLKSKNENIIDTIDEMSVDSQEMEKGDDVIDKCGSLYEGENFLDNDDMILDD